jgi:acyl dehydratase
MGLRYLEDLTEGLEGVSGRRTVTEADIMAFCGVSGDFNPLHTDELFIAEHTPFRARIAHGLLVLAISSGLRSELDELEIIAYLDVQRRFAAPTYAGDTIHARWKVTGTRASTSRPGTGVATVEVDVVNQNGDVLQHGTDVYLLATRDSTEGAA